MAFLSRSSKLGVTVIFAANLDGLRSPFFFATAAAAQRQGTRTVQENRTTGTDLGGTERRGFVAGSGLLMPFPCSTIIDRMNQHNFRAYVRARDATMGGVRRCAAIFGINYYKTQFVGCRMLSRVCNGLCWVWMQDCRYDAISLTFF